MPKVLIIAEAGVNHNGSLEVAKQMVDAAKECGADIIKFQTSKLDAPFPNLLPWQNTRKKTLKRTNLRRKC